LLDADADHESTGVAESRRAQLDLLVDAGHHLVAEDVEGHRGDENVVVGGFAIVESHSLVVRVDGDDLRAQVDMSIEGRTEAS